MNVTVTRQQRCDELATRVEGSVLWAHGLDVIADEVEALSLPVSNLEDVRGAVVARLRSDADATRREVERLRARIADVSNAQTAAVVYAKRA